jgi:protein-S-isoprenylcysteine O-methyltransferase Ste14
LAIYKAFTLENHTQWVDINEQVLELLKEEEINVNVVNESINKAWAKKEKKRKLKLYLKKIGAIVLLLGFFGMFYSTYDSGSRNNFLLYFILPYFLVRLAYAWWQRRKKSA